MIVINFKSDEFILQKAYFWYMVLGFFKFIEDADQNSYFPYNVFDMLGGRESMQALMRTQFGYDQGKAEKSDLVSISR